MRTLKKVLALTIALATLFSLTAFAAYKDESAIASETMSAVNLVNSLKIMTGDTKGNFNPTATITRAEAAKMVYVVRTGGNTNADGWKGQNVFTDTKGHWAEGFINYCASVGIIAGVGNGKFNPEGKLTGVELAKMLLVAAGYKADVQGYTGSAWQGKVLADAENAGLFNNYAPAYVGAAPRQYAAVMFSNCLLKTNMAVYLSGELVNGAIGTQVLVGTKYFGLATKTGIITEILANGFMLDGTPVSFKGANTDLAHQNVTVVCKMNGAAIDAVYDVYASGKSKVYNVKADDVSFGSTALELPGYEKTSYTSAFGMELYLTGALVEARENTPAGADPIANPANLDDTYAEVRAYYRGLGNNNDDLRFIDQTGDGKIDVVIHTPAVYGKVAENKAADGKFTVQDGASTPANIAAFCTTTTANYGKLVFADSVVKGDIVKLTVNMAGAKTIEKVEPIRGTFTAKNAADTVFTIGGTKYEFAGNAFKATSPADLGKEYNLYTDGVYLLWATTDAAAVTVNYGKDFALVIDAVNASGSGLGGVIAKVEVLFASGERKVMEYVDLDTGVKTDYINDDAIVAKIGTVQQYVIEDGQISFKTVITDPNSTSYTFKTDADRDVSFNNANQLFTLDGVSPYVKADDNTTVFVHYSGTKYAVVKASELNTFNKQLDGTIAQIVDGAKFVAYNTNKTTNVSTMGVVYVDLGAAGLPGTTTSATYAIFTGGKTEVYDADATSKTGYTLNVKYFDGTTATLKVSATDYATFNNVTDLGKFYTVVTDNRGISKLIAAAANVPNEFVYNVGMSAFGNNFIVAGGNYYAFADGVKVFYKNVNATAADYDLGELVVNDGEELVAGQNVSFTLKDGKITTLVVSFVAPN